MSSPKLQLAGPLRPEPSWWPERQAETVEQARSPGANQELARLQAGAGNRAVNQMLVGGNAVGASSASKRAEEESRWAAEFETDQRRLLELLRSTYYSSDDEGEVVELLSRWADRRTAAFKRSPAGLSSLRSDYLDRLFERLRQEPIWSRDFTSGKTNCYEVLFSSSFERAADVRALRDTNSIAFVGREKEADKERTEMEEEDRFAESLLGWDAGEFHFIGIDRSIASRAKADILIQRLAGIPSDRLTPMQRLLSEGVARDGVDFLLMQYRFVSAGDKLRRVKAIVREVVVLVLDFVLMEMTVGVASAALPRLLELSLGSARVAEAAGGAASLEAAAAREVLGSEALAGAGRLETVELGSASAKSLSRSGPPPSFMMTAPDEMAGTRARQLAADTEVIAVKQKPVLGSLDKSAEMPAPEVIASRQSPASPVRPQVQASDTLPASRRPELESAEIKASSDRGAQFSSPNAERPLVDSAGEFEVADGMRVVEHELPRSRVELILDETCPPANDATGQLLLRHVERAIEQYEEMGLRERQIDAIELLEQAGEMQRARATQAMYRGDKINEIFRTLVADDPALSHVYVTARGERGIDVFDSVNHVHYDLTTRQAWNRHLADYDFNRVKGFSGPYPMYRLPTEVH